MFEWEVTPPPPLQALSLDFHFLDPDANAIYWDRAVSRFVLKK
jgi:hypothetical protein